MGPSSRPVLTLLVSLVLLASCGTTGGTRRDSLDTVSLVRTGGFSGLEEHYLIEHGQFSYWQEFPGLLEKRKLRSTSVSADDLDILTSFLLRHWSSLLSVRQEESGNLTTSIVVVFADSSVAYSWPNLDPPVGSREELDSLYGIVSDLAYKYHRQLEQGK